MPGERDNHNDNDLQRGFEPLRTAIAIFVLLLGFAASARADGSLGTLLAQAPDGTSNALVALDSELRHSISGRIADVGIRQRFGNASGRWVEADLAAVTIAHAAPADMLTFAATATTAPLRGRPAGPGDAAACVPARSCACPGRQSRPGPLQEPHAIARALESRVAARFASTTSPRHRVRA